MDREEAFRTLSLHESADGEMVQTAYWSLVRRAQEEGTRDAKARRRIEAYNEAYQALQPDARHFKLPERNAPVEPEAAELLDRIVDWLTAEGLRTRQRWTDRLPEIGVLAGVSLFLMILALGAGAPFLLVALAWLLAFGAIWAPWREPRIDLGKRGEREEQDASAEAPHEKLAS